MMWVLGFAVLLAIALRAWWPETQAPMATPYPPEVERSEDVYGGPERDWKQVPEMPLPGE